jgi:plastocyanin
MTDSIDDSDEPLTIDDLTRRSVLRAAGGATALTLGTGTVSGATRDTPTTEQVGVAGIRNVVDPVFGFAAMGPNPCAGGGDGCLRAFPEQIRPSAIVGMELDIPGLLFGVAGSGGLSDRTTAAINEAAADGSVSGDQLPGGAVTVDGDRVPIRAIARALVDTVGFHFDPVGLRVEPGDVVMFNATSPDHAVAAFHELHGRQNRVPDDVGPLSSPLVPVGGFWLAQFETEGVYDLYCPPHAVFGMVMRVVVWDGEGEVPGLSVENNGRPPEGENALPSILAGLDPNVPSSAEVLESEALRPDHVASAGEVPWVDVVAEHRSG